MRHSPEGWPERFARFVEWKTRLAVSTPLPPYETETANPPAGSLTVGNDWTARLFDGPFYLSPPADAGRPACSLVFVQSRDGNTEAADPGVFGGGETDKHLVYEGLSRVAADAVLAGAGSVGRDQLFSVWHPQLVGLRAALGLPRHPVQIVASIRGVPLDRLLLFNVPEVRAVLVTVGDTAARLRESLIARPWVSVLVMDTPDHLSQALRGVLALGIERISCIGGRTLAGRFLEARLVDDVYLTTGVRDGGTLGTPLLDRRWRGRLVVRKRGTGAEAGVVFEHLRPVG